MNAASDRLEFAPPPQPGAGRAFALAVLAHVMLLLALTWGVHWKRDAENVAVEAELWSSVPHEAAPRLVQPPTPQPAPPPPPAPKPQPPVPAPPPVQVAPPLPNADIAIEREKKKLEQEKLEQQQLAQQRERQKQLDAQKREQDKLAEQKKQAQLQAQQLTQQREAEKKEAEKAQALAQAQAEAKAQAQAKALAQAKAQAAAKAQADKLHQDTVKNMLAMANATGGPGAKGNALNSSGPSGSYGARIAAAVRPNVVFPDADLVSGNPAATFDVRLAPDGTIVGTPRLVKSSGLPTWDEAALRALEKTEKLPRDIDGRVLPELTIDLKPKR